MKEGRPSLTAMYVAFARGVSSYEPQLSRACQDHVAESLLPPQLGGVLARYREGRLRTGVLKALRQSSFGMFDHLALRTRIIDDAVNQAVLSGVRQLVLLGAGLDGRAHRLPQLSNAVVFEVDHPSTQKLKRRNAADLPVEAKEIRYTPCDFQRVGLEQALASSNFDASKPSVWVWEGVTMYLPEAAVVASLDIIAKLSAPGSRLVVTYLEPTAGTAKSMLLWAGKRLLGAVAEPVRSQFPRQRMSELLRMHGFEPTTDLKPVALCERYGIDLTRPALAVPTERVSVADKHRNRPEESRA